MRQVSCGTCFAALLHDPIKGGFTRGTADPPRNLHQGEPGKLRRYGDRRADLRLFYVDRLVLRCVASVLSLNYILVRLDGPRGLSFASLMVSILSTVNYIVPLHIISTVPPIFLMASAFIESLSSNHPGVSCT